MSRLSRPVEGMRDHYDVVVVGSGYGGGIAASRMARAGRSVCLLERGRELQPGEYPGTLLEAAEHFQLDFPGHHAGSRTALYDMRLNEELHVFVGCGLGGTSLVNANVSLRADARVFEDPRWPQEVRDDLATGVEDGYRRAVEMLRPQPYPQDWPRLRKLAALERQAGELGAAGEFYRPPINVTFEDGVNHVGVEQRACVLAGDCVSGCNHRAKNTTLMNYLPDARNHGAEIFTTCAVRRVERADDGRWVVFYQLLESGREAFDAPETFVSADVVILAAGALGSTEILLRSQRSGLPTSDMVGRRFTGNGDVLGFAYNADEPIDGIGWGERVRDDEPPVGPCITGIVDLRATERLEDGMVIEEGSIPGPLGDLMPTFLAAASKLVGKDTDPGLGDEVEELGRELESLTRGPRHGAVRNTQTHLVMSHDDGEGRLALHEDRIRVSWPGVGDQPVFAQVGAKLLAATRALGATYVPDPISSKVPFNTDLVTVHPLGGCPMGPDAASGAVDHRGRVYAGADGTAVHDGLYVMDGAVVPRPLGVNPLLTISALAERACALLAADRGWNVDYALPSAPPADGAPEPALGIQFTERMAGSLAVDSREDGFAFVLTIRVPDLDEFVDDREHEAPMAGSVEAPGLSPRPLTVHDGRFNLFVAADEAVETRLMRYRMRLVDEDGREYFFSGTKTIHDDAGLDVWRDTTTLAITVHDGPDADAPVLGHGTLRIAPKDFLRQLSTMQATGAGGLREGLEAKARFGRFFAGTLFDVYGGLFARKTLWDPDAPPRASRRLRVSAPEVHTVTTRDGVQLRLTRFRGGDRGPVMLAHGLGVSSLIFTIDTIETNLLEYLFAHGFDCWLLDYRASIELPSAETQFTADEVATEDFPAAVEKVRAVTQAESVQVVAHCFGATTFTCAMLAGLQGVRSAVISQVSTDVAGPVMSRLKAGLHVPDVLDTVGIDTLSAQTGRDATWRGKLFNAIAGAMPGELEERCKSPVCHRISFMYAPLYEHDQLNAATHDALHEMFGVANMESFRHLARMVREGKVVGADGSDRYLPHVGRMAIPIAFIHGAENACFLTKGMDRTLERLSEVNGSRFYTRHEIPRYGHIDCIFGKDAHRDVFPLIRSHLQGAGA